MWLAAAAVGVLLAAPAARAATPADDCLADLAVLPAFLLENDTGARDHVAHKGQAFFDAALANSKGQAAAVDSDPACRAVLNEYVGAYRKTHLGVGGGMEEMRRLFVAPEAPQNAASDVIDARAPTLRMLSDKTALLVIPSFFERQKPALDALLRKHHRQLSTRPNLIVDVRHNNGGNDSTYDSLRPWLSAPRTFQVGVEFLATADNIASTERICDWFSPDPAACRPTVAPLLVAMRATTPGGWARLPEHEPLREEKLDRVHATPRRVAVLIGQHCGSACEQFLLDVRQSYKVKLYGRPTSGALDYSNLRPYPLPSGQRSLFYATSRSMRLPTLPIDLGGVQPDVLLPEPADEAAHRAEIDWVRKLLESTR
jgi:hypothetical protein